MAMIYYRFKGVIVSSGDYSFAVHGIYYSYKINDNKFLTGKSPFSAEKIQIILELIPNFCDLILLNLEKCTYDFGVVALTSDQVSEDQIMYLMLKGVDIETSKELSFDI